MQFEPDEEQRLLCDNARRFFSREFPLARLRDFEAGGWDSFLPVFRKMAEVGYLGLGLPEEAGGSGGSSLTLALFAEEAGRALVPTLQLTSVLLAGRASLAFGDEEARARVRDLVSGRTIIAPAWTEGDEPSREPPQATHVVQRGEASELAGDKRYVQGYRACAELLVSARDLAGATWLALVPRDATGIEAQEVRLSSEERVHHLRFANVAVPSGALMRADWREWLRIIDAVKVIAAAWAIGAARAALDMAIGYAKDRKQFGRPIGAFQAVQHRLADAAIALEQATAMVRYAAWLCDTPGDWRREAAMAKLTAGRALRAVTHAATLTHGGYGFMEEFDIQLYFRRAKALDYLVEGPAVQRELIAEDDGDDLMRV